MGLRKSSYKGICPLIKIWHNIPVKDSSAYIQSLFLKIEPLMFLKVNSFSVILSMLLSINSASDDSADMLNKSGLYGAFEQFLVSQILMLINFSTDSARQSKSFGSRILMNIQISLPAKRY